MSRNYSLTFSSKDVTISCIAIILIVALIISSNIFMHNYQSGSKVVNVYINRKLYDEYSIYLDDLKENEEKTIILKKEKHQVLLDDMEIKVNKNKGIKITKETSPRNICSQQPWINTPGVPLVCLPNQVYVVIESTSIDEPIPLE
ncbi:TPA: hypothetical protein GXZ54_07355 [bacterium]|jgi:hypothetical protein|nr:hypothetical protein [bacterium]